MILVFLNLKWDYLQNNAISFWVFWWVQRKQFNTQKKRNEFNVKLELFLFVKMVHIRKWLARAMTWIINFNILGRLARLAMKWYKYYMELSILFIYVWFRFVFFKIFCIFLCPVFCYFFVLFSLFSNVFFCLCFVCVLGLNSLD